ncbi:glycosyltransferase family 2 protein [Luteimonas sp. 100069]|uniref:glycosyltransferase family 2 protein n=1 Tax=Luteimonas sp. 100069 TaxID=2006109 RepID=UPI000F50F733|nr:glycosyltransferase family 2 protein [Luteimonas sp. 100069]RPD87777.1 glycosyltransferase family 2 protein [Luteimonas sp. 100069]
MNIELLPAQQLLRLGETDENPRWRATGSDPFFDARLPSENLQGGWYFVDIEVEVLRGRVHAPVLYPDYGRGYVVENESIAIPLHNARSGRYRIRRLVRFIAEVTGLRFDPTLLPGEFRILEFSLTRVDKGAAARSMLESLWDRCDGAGRVRLVGRTLMDLIQGPRRMAERLYAGYSAGATTNDLSDYDVWLDFYDECTPEGIALALDSMPPLDSSPLFSVLLPTYNTDLRWLRACIESLQAQTYGHWELCIADDASPSPDVWELIQSFVVADSRIKAVRRESNGHIAAASNSALLLATGDYIALLDHDDALHPLALQWCALELERNPSWRMLFTDEDKIDEHGRRSDPYFKSDWNPDLFLSQNCVCHLGVYARDLVESIGGFRPGFDGAQDWDLALRATEKLTHDQIGHIPKVLYHWRMIEGSTALAPGEKSYAHFAAMRAIQDHFDRTGVSAKVEEMPGYSGYYHIAHALPEQKPRVSLLIPTRDRVDLLRQCIDSILDRTNYDNYEIVVLDNGSIEAETHAYLKRIALLPNVRVLDYDAPFNYSEINNFGALHSEGEIIGLLNNDIEVISRDWLTEMVSHAQRPEIGVVGAMLYYPNDTIQHAGVVLGIGGVAGHCYAGMPRGYPGDKHRAGLVQNVSAVTAACAIVRREVFEQVGGLDESLVVAFNDVDFCIRVRKAGYRNLWTPFAELYHHESASRGYENTPEKIARFKREEAFMKRRWGEVLDNDPYYNPNFSLVNAPYTLAYPPRVPAPSAIGRRIDA